MSPEVVKITRHSEGTIEVYTTGVPEVSDRSGSFKCEVC